MSWSPLSLFYLKCTGTATCVDFLSSARNVSTTVLWAGLLGSAAQIQSKNGSNQGMVSARSALLLFEYRLIGSVPKGCARTIYVCFSLLCSNSQTFYGITWSCDSGLLKITCNDSSTATWFELALRFFSSIYKLDGSVLKTPLATSIKGNQGISQAQAQHYKPGLYGKRHLSATAWPS